MATSVDERNLGIVLLLESAPCTWAYGLNALSTPEASLNLGLAAYLIRTCLFSVSSFAVEPSQLRLSVIHQGLDTATLLYLLCLGHKASG